jgi:hypothetical protein
MDGPDVTAARNNVRAVKRHSKNPRTRLVLEPLACETGDSPHRNTYMPRRISMHIQRIRSNDQHVIQDLIPAVAAVFLASRSRLSV